MLLLFLKDYEDDFDDIDDEDDEEYEDRQQQDEEEKEVERQFKKGPIAKNSEVEEIQKAINAENEKIQTLFPKQRTKELLSKNSEKEQTAGSEQKTGM